MEPLIGSKSKSKVLANGRGRRKRHLPGGSQSREEDSTLIRLSQSRTEGGGNGAAHIDSHNMDFDRLVSNAIVYMPAMQFPQVKVSDADMTETLR